MGGALVACGRSAVAGALVLGLQLAMPWGAQAQPLPDPAAELRRQQEQIQQQRQRLEGGFDARSPAPLPSNARLPLAEARCFHVGQVVLEVQRGDTHPPDIGWLRPALAGPQQDDPPEGRCLGSQGIDLLLTRVQDALLRQGWITSRVFAQPQDVRTGVLTLTVLPGRVHAIRLAGPDQPSLRNTLPLRSGDVLSLRDIEQALENLKRNAGAEADIRIEAAPMAGPDQSDLLIAYTAPPGVRFTATLDDAGSQATGRLQGSATMALDNPLGWSDQFYLTLNHDLTAVLGRETGNTLPGERGTRGYTVHYALPLDYWTVGATHTSNRYYQTVYGPWASVLYSGTSENNDIAFTRLFYRDATRKASASLKAWQRESSNFIDDTEVLVQRRSVGGYELGLGYQQAWGDARLDAAVAYKRGTPDFDALPAPEEAYNEGTARFGLLTLDLGLSLPLHVQAQDITYTAALRVQDNTTPLTPQDRFAIGSRATVRGFDGETSLVGERGWTLRNEASMALGDSGQHLYLGLDAGEVSGPSTESLPGTTLSGAVLGLRGTLGKLQYDVFIGAPLSKPAGFRTAETAAGFSLTLSL